MLSHLIDEFKKQSGLDVKGDKLVIQRLREAAEKAKCELSSAPNTEINLPFLTADATGMYLLEPESAHARTCHLSLASTHQINLSYLIADGQACRTHTNTYSRQYQPTRAHMSPGPKHLNLKMTRAQLDQLVGGLIDRTKEPCKAALKDAGLQTSEVKYDSERNILYVLASEHIVCLQKLRAMIASACACASERTHPLFLCLLPLPFSLVLSDACVYMCR